MNRLIIIIFLLLIILSSCNKREERLCNELNKIANAVAVHTQEPGLNLQMSDILAPKRYHDMFILYWDISNEIHFLTDLLDSVIKSDTKTISFPDIKKFDALFILLDSLYIPRLDSVKGEDNHGNNYQYTQLSFLNKYVEPLKEKIEFSSSLCDLELARLYLMLIEREVIAFINEEAINTTVPINFLKPITIKEGNILNCYFAAVDTCNYTYILIGKYEHIQLKDRVLYRELYIHDTVYFNQEKAILDLSKIKEYEAIAVFTGPHGEPIQFKFH